MAEQGDKQEILDRREAARRAAMARTKVVNRTKLSDQKKGDPTNPSTILGGKSNMLNFTGKEANGWQWTPSSTLQVVGFFMMLIVGLHVLGEKILPGIRNAQKL